MSDDVREKVARAIYEARYPWTWSSASDGSRLWHREIADAAVAAHLSALGDGGYAVIKLPPPDHENSGFYGDEPSGKPLWQRDGKHGGYASIIAQPGEVMAAINCLSTPDDMRWAAAALLAAAAEADR